MNDRWPVPDSDPVLPAAVLDELWPEDRVLTSLPVGAALAGVGIGAVAWAAVQAGRARRAIGSGVPRSWHRALGPATAAASGGLAIVLGAAIGVNSRSGYVPTWEALRVKLVGWGVGATPPARPTPHGTVRTLDIPGGPGALMADQAAWVYLPPGFDPDGAMRYPVVYLLHGTPDDPSSWFAGGHVPLTMDVLISHGLIDPMIVVSPTTNGAGPGGLDTECLDSTKGGEQAETYLTTTVVETIDRVYPTLADREHRVIGGMSAGAFGALNLGLRHLDDFGTILGIETYGEPGESAERAMLSSQAEIDANTPLTYLPTMTFTQPVAVLLDSGAASSKEATTTEQMAAYLEGQGQTVWLREEPGLGHTWRMAAVALPHGLVFAQQQMDRADARTASDEAG